MHHNTVVNNFLNKLSPLTIEHMDLYFQDFQYPQNMFLAKFSKKQILKMTFIITFFSFPLFFFIFSFLNYDKIVIFLASSFFTSLTILAMALLTWKLIRCRFSYLQEESIQTLHSIKQQFFYNEDSLKQIVRSIPYSIKYHGEKSFQKIIQNCYSQKLSNKEVYLIYHYLNSEPLYKKYMLSKKSIMRNIQSIHLFYMNVKHQILCQLIKNSR